VGAVSALVALSGCGGGSTGRTSPESGSTGSSAAPSSASRTSSTESSSSGPSQTGTTSTTTTQPVAHQAPAPLPPRYPHVLGVALSTQPTPFVPAVTWKGQPVVWVARSPSGVAMLSFKQPALQLRLHSGTTDAGTIGWRYGPVIAGLERKRLVAAFNGGFRLSVGVGGFESLGRTAAPLGDGLGSVVTYIDGTTDIGSWHHEVPASGRTVASVRQNLPLLIDHGTAASTLDCVSCWGATLGGVIDPARSALGIQANGHLIWAGAEHATVSTIADALLSAGVVRAVELDINPEWVAGYLYGHGGGAGPLDPVPVVPGQQGIPGQFLEPWSRDFFTIAAT
jgi:hypothetical protein